MKRRLVGGVMGLLATAGTALAVGMGEGVGPEPSQPAIPSEVPEASAAAEIRGVGTSTPSLTELPVILVPGWFANDRDLAALRIRLLGAGWDHVEAIDFDDPTGSNRAHALEIESTVRSVMERSGAPAVDIVAHSMGGLATRWYLLTEPGAPVRRVVFIASPHRGTLAAHIAFGDGRDEMVPGSAFLDTLNAAPSVPPGVEGITIWSPLDLIILPGESATLPGLDAHRVCCPTHEGLLLDQEVFTIVRAFLDDGGR